MKIEAFLELAEFLPVLDVRSPSEYTQGHIQNAVSFPLFSDEERAIIGTAYKKESREKAIELGHSFADPRAQDYIDRAHEIAIDNQVLLHCWRGGMRSEAMSQLLRSSGLEVEVLEGGYKSYRQWVKEEHDRDHKLLIVGGYTGTAKTEILKQIEALGEQFIDLEGLAHHRGSAFGQRALRQPSTEEFENRVAHALRDMDQDRIIWLEDESHHIGSCWIDRVFFDKMRRADLLILDRSIEDRVAHLCELYGQEEMDYLRDSFERIEKRLGGQNVKLAIEALDEGDMATAARIALYYYDKTYNYGIEKRKDIRKFHLNIEGLDHQAAAEKILRWKNETYDYGKDQANHL